MKRDKLDKVFSDLVRERANWTCEKCGKVFPERKGMGLHCSHFYSRRHQNTRFDLENAFAHCFGCHQYLGGNPAIFAEWALEHMGQARYDALRERHNEICKRTKVQKEELYSSLREQLAKAKEDAIRF